MRSIDLKMEENNMNGLVSTIIGVMLSGLICSYVLNFLNNNIWSIFNEIRKDLGKLSNKTRRILSFLGFLLAILITVLLNIMLNISSFVEGLMLGFLLSVKDACFKENDMKINNEQY